MILTKQLARELAKIERRHNVKISGVIVTQNANGRLSWGISWIVDVAPEDCDAFFLRAMANRLSPWTLIKIAVRKLSRAGV